MHMTRSPASSVPPPSGVSPGEALDLSISGSQVTMTTRRPNSSSPGQSGKMFTRSVSVIGETRRSRNTLVDSLGVSRSIKNLRRSNSTTQVNHSSSSGGRHSPQVSDEYLSLLYDKPAPDATTWNILDEQPRVQVQSSPRSSSNKRREAALSLAATFTANNRSNKGAVGNSVSTILQNNNHNQQHTDKPLTPKSHNQRPAFNNLVKSGDGVCDVSSVTKSQKNFSFCSAVLSAAPHRRRDATEEEAERFIEQVNSAAVTIQRWFRLCRRKGQRQSNHDFNHTLNHAHTERLHPEPLHPEPLHSEPLHPEQQTQVELQRLLSSKKKELEQRKLGGCRSEHRDEERRRIREEKARLARLQAIQELQQKRAQRSLEPEFNCVEPEPPRNSGRSKRESRTGPETGSEIGPETGPETRSETRSETISETRPETRPEIRAQTRPRPEARAHTGARPETRGQTRARPEFPGDKNKKHSDTRLNIDLSDLNFRAVSPASPNVREPEPEPGLGPEQGPEPGPDSEPVRLCVSRKKPPLLCAPLSPNDTKTNNTDGRLNMDLTDLTFRAVSPASSNHRDSTCDQELYGQSQCKDTLSELLDSLRLLEEEPCKLQPNNNKYCKDKYTGLQEFDCSSLTADNLQRHVLQSPAAPDGGALLSEAKLHSIITFLDEMEQSEQERPGSHPEVLVTEEELGLEQASATAAELSGNMTRIRLELDEKKRTVHMLQAALVQQRELSSHHVRDTETKLNKKFELQKKQYEMTINRHLQFIDQLISDKKSLSDRCEEVVSQLKQVDSKYTKKIQHMQEQHNMEIKKLKELMSASEKVKREKWIDEKTKKIKEITVKGLEPEIQALISRHKQELNKLRSLHQEELMKADERAERKNEQHTEELKRRLESEREEACVRERESAKQRFEKQLQEEELSLQQQRRRLYKEVSEEKERLNQHATRQREELEEMRRRLEENSSEASRNLREELTQRLKEQETTHKMELKSLQDRMEQERQTWEDTYRSKQEVWLRSRERELKEELKRERDKEIELAVWTLEEQTSKEREENERATENRVQRLKQKFESQLQELEISEKNAIDKQQETRTRLLQREEQLLCLQSDLRLRDQTIHSLRQACEKLTSERQSLADVIRVEFEERLVQTEAENRDLQKKERDLRVRLRLDLQRVQREKEEELQRVQREKEDELQQVHDRVKVAILKKEETVNNLRKQHEAAVKRADHLEALWEQQRKQLLEK